MAKGDDAIRKKRNKANRKKISKDPTTVSSRIAAIIAAKKRRKLGNRRMCEGMCFSLPTLDDPFNDRLLSKKLKLKQQEKDMKLNPTPPPIKLQQQGDNNYNNKKKTKVFHGGLESVSFPSKFLIQCLNSIYDQLQRQGGGILLEETQTPTPFSSYKWGIDFCKSYLTRNHILDTSASSATVHQIAWIVSTAADHISRKEEKGLILPSPFLLYLVPSQHTASKVRSICKPLKLHGIHTVSLHPGAAIDHQIDGLKTCEPEFIVSTPERLLELVSMEALDLSGVSFLVLDGVEPSHLDAMQSIRKSISRKPLTIVFNDYLNHASTIGVRNLLTGPICRLSSNDSISCQSAYITQSVHVCALKERKLLKGIKILNQECRRETGKLVEVLFVVEKPSKILKLVTALNSNGYSVSTDSNVDDSTDTKNRKTKPVVSVIDMRHISTIDIQEYGLVIILDFCPPFDIYVQKILLKMARHTTNGKLHIMMTEEDASLAEPLIQNLEACGQAVPEALRNLCAISPMLEE